MNGQAGSAFTNEKKIFNVKNLYHRFLTLLNSSNYTSGQASNIFNSKSKFLIIKNLHEHF